VPRYIERVRAVGWMPSPRVNHSRPMDALSACPPDLAHRAAVCHILPPQKMVCAFESICRVTKSQPAAALARVSHDKC
jgi:hypothetical protein